MTIGKIDLVFKASTDGFVAGMGEAGNAAKGFRRSIEEVGRSSSVLVALGRDIDNLVTGIAKGDVGSAFTGIAMGARDAALAIPTVTTSIRGVAGMGGALAATAGGLGTLAAAGGVVAGSITAVTAAVLSGVAAWNSYAAASKLVEGYSASLAGMNKGSTDALQKETTALEAATKQLALFGLTTGQAKVAVASEALAERQEAVERTSELWASLAQKVQTAEGDALTIAKANLDVVSERLRTERQRAIAAEGMLEVAKQYESKETAAAQAAERKARHERAAAEAAREYAKLIERTNAASANRDARNEERLALYNRISGMAAQAFQPTTQPGQFTQTNAMIVAVAGRVFDDVYTQLDDVGSAFVDSVTGGTTRLGELYNQAVDVFGVETTDAVTDFVLGATDTLSGAIDAARPALEAAASSLANSAGDLTRWLSDVYAAASSADTSARAQADKGGMSAAQAEALATSAASMGGVAAAFIALAQRTKAFGEITAMLDGVFGQAVESIEPLVAAMKPLIQVLVVLTSFAIDFLTPILQGFEIVLEGLYYLIKGIVLFTLYFWQKVGEFWNALVETIASVFDSLAGFELFGARPFGFMDSWGDSIRNGKIGLDGLNDKIDELTSTTFDSVKAQETLADTADKVTEALTNVPEGYKLALRRFDATTPEDQMMQAVSAVAETIAATTQQAAVAPTYIPPAPVVPMQVAQMMPYLASAPIMTTPTNVDIVGGAMDQAVSAVSSFFGRSSAPAGMNVQTLTVVAQDPEEMFARLRGIAAQTTLTRSGTPLTSTASPYTTPRWTT